MIYEIQSSGLVPFIEPSRLKVMTPFLRDDDLLFGQTVDVCDSPVRILDRFSLQVSKFSSFLHPVNKINPDQI